MNGFGQGVIPACSTIFTRPFRKFCDSSTTIGKTFWSIPQPERRENPYRKESIERTRIVKPSDLLKCVAATYLFQPNRAARDYRGIRKEFENEIFKQDHSAEPYYLACFASYKFDFMVRNKRVPKSWQLYKYYALYGLGVRACNSKRMFDLRKADTSRSCAEIARILREEEFFVEPIKVVSNILEKIIADAKLVSRVDIRDQLRLYSFAKKFDGEFESQK